MRIIEIGSAKTSVIFSLPGWDCICVDPPATAGPAALNSDIHGAGAGDDLIVFSIRIGLPRPFHSSSKCSGDLSPDEGCCDTERGPPMAFSWGLYRAPGKGAGAAAMEGMDDEVPAACSKNRLASA